MSDEAVVLECPTCAKAVAAKFVCAYAHESEETPWGERFSLFRCPRCGEPFLCGQDGFPMQDNNTGGCFTSWGAHATLYPQPPTRPDPSVPKPIAGSYVEAQNCFRAGASTATAIMCRRTLEGLCVHFGASEGNLKRKLELLHQKGTIERRLFEWADALRLAGNDAAHDVNETMSKEDAKDLLDFTRAILEYVFTFAAAFEAFQARRSKRKVAAEGAS